MPPSHDPYAPPQAQQVAAPASSERGGFWSDGKRLVMHRDARLPDRCLRCNRPATTRLKKTLHWHHPAIYLVILLHILIYAIVALIVRKKLPTEVPLCDRHASRRRWGIGLSWLGFLGLFGFVFGGFVIGDAIGGDDAGAMLGVTGFFVALILLFVGLFVQTVVRATKIDDTYGYLVVGKPFLASCPPLP